MIISKIKENIQDAEQNNSTNRVEALICKR